jgi:hypothetical protein
LASGGRQAAEEDDLVSGLTAVEAPDNFKILRQEVVETRRRAGVPGRLEAIEHAVHGVLRLAFHAVGPVGRQAVSACR